MTILFLLPFILFMALQGALIFITARFGLRLVRGSRWLGKVLAMLLSYFGWIFLTITAYMLLGGDGGLMDGFGFVLLLCFAALISSLLYLIVWVLRPSKGERAPKEEILIEPWA